MLCLYPDGIDLGENKLNSLTFRFSVGFLHQNYPQGWAGRLQIYLKRREDSRAGKRGSGVCIGGRWQG